MKRVLQLAALGLAALTLATCNNGEAPPVPGSMNVQLATPNTDDGGIIFRVSGGSIDSVTTAYPTIYTQVEADSSEQVLIAGNLGAGTIAQIWIPDVHQLSSYTATPLQVASRTSYAQRKVSGYKLTLTATK